ncbi:hypothetical protein NOF55_19980 [Rhizobiaceae bacterium BDR2-2]|uniref:Uncharacterized protein n=1 Tax=Ectorhizobium quercum TaxID=2965071 RepID=A0AAE3N523_9HYPH|nr:hypothetical protein [Ectorhizobium quercum]MCX8999390.1 hypothetical protein [Ectorhizobium quercum]
METKRILQLAQPANIRQDRMAENGFAKEGFPRRKAAFGTFAGNVPSFPVTNPGSVA